MSDFKRHLVVTRKASGLGSDLVSVAGAIHYARSTSRDVMIDWRRSKYLPDSQENLFPRIFRTSKGIDGVEVHEWHAELQDSLLPGPLNYSRGQNFETYHFEMVADPRPVAETAIVERPMHHLPDMVEQKALFGRISPNVEISTRISAFRDREFGNDPVIGVHIRHGNGENLKHGRNGFIANPIDRIVELINARIRAQWDAGVKVFFCTDSQELRDTFCAQWPNTCHFGSPIGRAGTGGFHHSKPGYAHAENAVAEMWLLSLCTGIVYNPSWFSHYARVMGTFDREPQNLDESADYGTMAVYEKSIQKRAGAGCY